MNFYFDLYRPLPGMRDIKQHTDYNIDGAIAPTLIWIYVKNKDKMIVMWWDYKVVITSENVIESEIDMYNITIWNILFLGFEILNIHLIISATADLIKFLSDIVCINKSKQGKGKGWQNMVNRFLRTIHVLVIMEYSPEDQCHNLIQTVVTT